VTTTSQLTTQRLLKFIRLSRLLRLGRIMKVDHLFVFLEEKVGFSSRMFDLMKMIALVLCIGHVSACMFWYLPELMTKETWFDHYGYRNANVYDQYVLTLYWTFTTLSTVGYGDIVARNSAERVLSCIIMLIGASLFGYVVANMSEMATTTDPAETKIKAHIREVRRKSWGADDFE